MSSGPETFWDHQALQPASTAHRLWVGDRAILFDAASQQIFELNESSAAIWSAVCHQGTLALASRSLVEDDDQYQVVIGHARQALAGWLRLGLLRPASLPARASAASREVRLRWLDCRVGLTLSGEVDIASLLSVFAEFVSTEAPASFIQVHGLGDMVFISDDQGRGCAVARDAWIPEVKARFTTKILEAVKTGFLVHAALLSRHDNGLLVCGTPGAGKTTVSVSLLLAGFGYHADDIVWISDEAEAVGAPFAPALKEGSWPLLREMGGDVPTSPAYLRGDGQGVKYLLPPSVGRGPARLGAILLLARESSGPARIETVEPLEALTAILGSAYSARGAISPTTLTALIASIEGCRIGRLRFSQWADAQRVIDTFAP